MEIRAPFLIIIWVSKERLIIWYHILMCATQCCHTGEKKTIGSTDMEGVIQRKNCGMGSGSQNYRGSGIPILSGACQFDVSTLDVVI